MIEDNLTDVVCCAEFEEVTCMLLYYSNILLFYSAVTIIFLTVVIGFLSWALLRKNNR